MLVTKQNLIIRTPTRNDELVVVLNLSNLLILDFVNPFEEDFVFSTKNDLRSKVDSFNLVNYSLMLLQKILINFIQVANDQLIDFNDNV